MKKVLLVDDSSEIRNLLKFFLSYFAERYDIREAVDGESALKLVQDWNPDLVFLDVVMPGGKNGFDVCAEIKANPICTETKVVLLTGLDDSKDIEKGLSAGADAYVRKPFKPNEISELARSLLR